MRHSGVAGISRVALRERLILLEPRAKGIMGTTLHHNYEVRSDSVYFDDIPDLEIGELLDLASHIIETKKARFDPEKFKDHYQEAVPDLGGARCCAWWMAGERPAMMQQCNRRLRWQPSNCQLSLQGSKSSPG
jgi:non-homologous end joining protein Ku